MALACFQAPGVESTHDCLTTCCCSLVGYECSRVSQKCLCSQKTTPRPAVKPAGKSSAGIRPGAGLQSICLAVQSGLTQPSAWLPYFTSQSSPELGVTSVYDFACFEGRFCLLKLVRLMEAKESFGHMQLAGAGAGTC